MNEESLMGGATSLDQALGTLASELQLPESMLLTSEIPPDSSFVIAGAAEAMQEML